MVRCVLTGHECKFTVIKGGLDPVKGVAKWDPNEAVPTATYLVRAFVVSSSSCCHSVHPWLLGKTSPELF